MSLLDKLFLPKKLALSGLIMIAALAVAIAIEYFSDFETSRYVKTVFFYLLLDYCWATFRREYLGDRF
ncbi:MAG: hypothetical protein JF615_13015 [Asticcacaulis sp.]|nr:hypothetical protein [Asticcacaulis sp.]